MQNLRLRFTALFLILLLTPKSGLELYSHELLHQAKNNFETSHNDASPKLNSTCHCFDDVSMPLAEAVAIIISCPEKESVFIYIHNVFALNSISKNFLLLRGPPIA